MLANVLTLLRPVFATLFALSLGFFVRDGQPSDRWGVVLVVLMILAELTDLLDGMAARKMGTASVFGGILDPLSDSLSRLVIFFAMALVGWIPLAVPFVMAGRDIIVAYTRIANALTNSSTSARISGKAKAVFQGAAMFVLVVVAWLASPAGSVHELSWLRWLDAETVRMIQAVTGIVVIVATGWSLIDYIRGTLPAIRQLRQR